MKKLPKFRLFYTVRIAFILAAIGVLMYWGGPYPVNGSVARLHLDGLPVSLRGGYPGLVVSGHRFACDRPLSPRELSPEIRNRCATDVAGKLLELEFQIRPFQVDFCQLKYGARVMKCHGIQDYRNRADQADFWVEDSLELTAFDRLWLLLNNPLANIFGNISELDWNPLMKILPWVISSLFGVGIWLDFRKLSMSKAILFGLTTLFLTPFFERLVLGLVVITGHVD